MSGSIEKIGETWIAESPMGKVEVRFVEANRHGVLDHEVTLQTGAKVYNPRRVFPNHLGSELVFTLYRLPEMSEEAYAADVRAVERDFRTLKSILESQG